MSSIINITEIISAAEARESNVVAVLEMISPLPLPERVQILAAALLKLRTIEDPRRLNPFVDEPVAAPAPELPPATLAPSPPPSPPAPNPSKARPKSRKGSGQDATRLLSKEDVGRLVELVQKHPGSSSPWLAKQLGVNPAVQRWRNTLQALLETGILRKDGKDNKTRYFKLDAGPA